MPANDFVQPFAGINLFGHNIMVPLTGLEPARYRYRGILSPLCLPIPPHQQVNIDSKTIIQQHANKINSGCKSLILKIDKTGFVMGFVIKYRYIELA